MANNPDRRDAGLTLLEMVLVVIVLIILTGIVLPIASSLIEDAKVAKILQTHEMVSQAVRRYVADTGKTPDLLYYLWEKAGDPNAAAWDGPYIDRPVGFEDNPYGGDLSLFEGISFDLDGEGVNPPTTSVCLAFEAVPDSISLKINGILDAGIPEGAWETRGRVMYSVVPGLPQYTLFIFIMKEPP